MNVDKHPIIILAIMIIAGLLGGMFQFVHSTDPNPELWKLLCAGIAGSFVVPLLLHLMSSDLMKKDHEYQKLFVFGALCLIASIFSKDVIEIGKNGAFADKLKETDLLVNSLVETTSGDKTKTKTLFADINDVTKLHAYLDSINVVSMVTLSEVLSKPIADSLVHALSSNGLVNKVNTTSGSYLISTP